MASYFGEVVHPSSRAFWTEVDDDELPENISNVEFSFKWSEPEPSTIDKLLIVESEMLTEYVKTSILQNTKCVCTIDDSANQECARIHFDSNAYICTVSKKVDLGYAGHFTKAIVSLLSKASKLYIFISNHISNYKSEDCDSSSLIRALYSHRAKEDKVHEILVLDQPNIVSGVGAGVLSYAEIANLYCIMYILYTDTFSLDSKNALPLVQLFSKLLGRSFPNVSKDSLNSFDKGNLYM